MKKTNIVNLAMALLDTTITNELRVVIKNQEIEFFEKGTTKATAAASIIPGQKIVDNDGTILTDGEYKISPSKVTRVGDVTVDEKVEKEAKAAKHQDKTTRSGSPLAPQYDRGL